MVFRISASVFSLTGKCVKNYFHEITRSPAKLVFTESLKRFLSPKTNFDEPQIKICDATFLTVIFGQFFRCINTAAAAAAGAAVDLSYFFRIQLTLLNRWTKYYRTKLKPLVAKSL